MDESSLPHGKKLFVVALVGVAIVAFLVSRKASTSTSSTTPNYNYNGTLYVPVDRTIYNYYVTSGVQPVSGSGSSLPPVTAPIAPVDALPAVPNTAPTQAPSPVSVAPVSVTPLAPPIVTYATAPAPAPMPIQAPRPVYQPPVVIPYRNPTPQSGPYLPPYVPGGGQVTSAGPGYSNSTVTTNPGFYQAPGAAPSASGTTSNVNTDANLSGSQIPSYLTSLSTADLQAREAANSAAWSQAPADVQDHLHQENIQIESLLNPGSSYNATTGVWH